MMLIWSKDSEISFGKGNGISKQVFDCTAGGEVLLRRKHASVTALGFVHLSLSHPESQRGRDPTQQSPLDASALGWGYHTDPHPPLPQQGLVSPAGEVQRGAREMGARRRIEVPLNHSGSYFVADYWKSKKKGVMFGPSDYCVLTL